MFRNWILQDLSHAFPPRSLQAIGTTSIHTNQIKNRGFWNLFEFSRKEDNSKNAEKLSDNKSKTDCNSTKTSLENEDKLNDVSKDTAVLSRTVMTNSEKVYSFKNISKCNYTFRYVPRIKSKKKSSETNFQNDEFTSLLDGNFVPTNMKLKLKGYKTLRNEQAKDFAFIPGDKSLDLDIIPTKNEEENTSYKLSKPAVSMDLTKLQTVPLKETKDHSEIESLFPTENKISMNDINPDDPSTLKHASNKAQESSHNFINVKQESETKTMLEENILPERKETKTESSLQLESQGQVKSQIEPKEIQKEFESKVQQLEDNKKDEVRLHSDETAINYLKEEPLTLNSQNNSKNLSEDLSKQADQAQCSINSLNQSKTQNNLKESDNANKIGQSSASYFLSKRISLNRINANYSKSNSSGRNLKDNPTVMSKFRSKIPRYSMYESRKEQQRRASSPCDITFIKARENSTKQRWSGFDRPASRCYPGGSSGSHGSRSQGSTHPYPSTMQTREASSKCYAREKDPIVRSNIIPSSCEMLKTRNSVTGGSITATNIDNRKLYSNISSTKRILLGSKSSIGLTNTQQSFAYGCCKKPKKPCAPKKCKETCDEPMIPGKIICTKPRTKCCPKPKCCRPEKKPSCTKQEAPPPRPCCQKKKKKICKRYCCPSLKVIDCIANRGTCPGKCSDKVKEENQELDDPSCLTPKELSNQKKTDYDTNERDCCSSRKTCCAPKKCSRNFNCMEEKEDDCLDTIQNRDCNKPKKKDCCKRSCKRSKSCGNRRYHSGTKSRKTKSHVSIPLFDVNMVVLRPYQNDAELRFYSSCGSDWKPPSLCKKDQKEDTCKSKCTKPEPPKCLNTKKSEPCNKPLESLSLSKDCCDKPKDCNKPKKECCDKPKDCCDKPKETCTTKKTDDICCKSKTDRKDKKEASKARWARELREIQKCKNIGKDGESCKKCSSLEKFMSSCKKNNKLESIDLSNDFDPQSPSFQLNNSFIPFCLGPTGSSLLNFGMKSNNIIPNRSISTTKITKDSYRDEMPIIVETELPEKEWADEESSSE
ncbi:serine/arginine repetitive matrix protein 2-like [Vespula squamosa]|uniref:Serine/arginine repetitive matrix protein 2-like n=1 Tax=Vespula squamosa TaxID=30214 RepID=A0ABD1ZWH8_VESSQ